MPAGRPRDPSAPYRVYRHTIGGYAYAATRGYTIDETTGEAKRRIAHWGRLAEGDKFIPNEAYMMLAPSERQKLIFPPDWDLSEARKLPSERGRGRPASEGAELDRLYGAAWFLERIAEKLGVIRDLEAAFEGNREKALDVLTLAIYLYTNGEPFSHVAEWQNIEWYPSVRRLSPAAITRLLKSITQHERVCFTDLRKARLGKESVCAVDSTTRTSRGTTLPDAAVGKSKDGGYALQTTETVVYSLSTHEPVYYQTLPGNVPDAKVLPAILTDLHQAGYKDLVLVTDRGYECQRNLEMCILRKQKLITAANVNRRRVLERIRELGDVSAQPANMEWLADKEVFCRQFELEMEVQGRGGKTVRADRLRLNLYLNPIVRAREMVDLQNIIATQKADLQTSQEQGLQIRDEDCRTYFCYRLKRDGNGRIESFALDVDKVRRMQETLGFFSNITLGVDFTAAEALRTYRLRDEQEKYFYSMKTRIDCDMQRNWSEKARRGARFVEFVALILIAHVKHIWSDSKKLRSAFKYVRAIILTMRQIHRIERPGKDKVILPRPFLAKQMLICEQFGLDVPADCRPEYASLEVKPKRKRGRPKKDSVSQKTE